MNAHDFSSKYILFGLVMILSVFIVGCATKPRAKPIQSSKLSDIEGKWSWRQQGPWHGYFVLEKKGSTYTGTLDDTFEGTYGDRIEDLDISDDHIKFERNGAFGTQHWEGTLKKEHGVLKITDGRWEKQGGIASGWFFAEKMD
jgi:hypothetical protein